MERKNYNVGAVGTSSVDINHIDIYNDQKGNVIKGRVYLAGPLFAESEIEERKMQAKRLRELGYSVYNPLEMNGIKGIDRDDIYKLDIRAMELADFGIVNLDNFDSGTVAELGWFVGKNKKVYSLWTNWKSDVPPNLFVEGLVKVNDNKLFNSNEDLFKFLLNS